MRYKQQYERVQGRRAVIQKRVNYHGPCVLACDGRCDKAWGINGRPRVLLSDKDDDHVDVPDSALGTAPPPGETNTIAEGWDRKPSATPITDGERMNRWCARECERCGRHDLGEAIGLRTHEDPEPNIPGRPNPFVRDAQGRACLSTALDVEFWRGDERVTRRALPLVPLAEVLAS